ncbi:MAG: T9SS type A sorting domain-containing protein [Phaeodactylibacter sp.]|nr:T9SS type A sorting domain-containing protein [Phaeodactylibacter sp.]
MKTKITLSLLATLSMAILNAQEFVQVPLGASYSNQAYYNIGNDDMAFLPNESWDLAFTTAADAAGIFYNEAATASFSGEAPELRLYLAPTNDFADVIDPEMLLDSLYNEEIDWENGAFNSVKEENDPDDYGWGTYDSGNQMITGSKVYALKLRNNSWKKIFIESLANGVYTVKHAGLDGANEATVLINQADFAGSPLALFSFGTGTATASPADWNLLFIRYRTELDPGNGAIVQYMVTGVLSGPGVETAEARNIDPTTVSYEPYLDSLDTQLDIIGQDWKFFDLGGFEWVIDPERAFFVKTPDNRLWKVVFYSFDGSSTGIFTFEKTDLGLISGVEAPASNFTDFSLFPNPAADEMTVSFSLKERRDNLPLSMMNTLGQAVWHTSVRGDAGLNILNLQAGELAPGVYFLNLGTGKDRVTTKVVIE